MIPLNILMLLHKMDSSDRYNYHINFGIVDALNNLNDVNIIKFDLEVMANSGYEFLLRFLEEHNIQLIIGPMRKRWENILHFPSMLNKADVPMVLMDTDSYAFDFNNEFYSCFYWIFYRNHDKNNDTPSKGSFLPRSIDTDIYDCRFGGNGTVLCGSFTEAYPSRLIIRDKLHPDIVDCSQHFGKDYILHLQKSLLAISTNSNRMNYTAAKLLEIASCGTAILTERTSKLDVYFDEDLLYIFDGIDELKYYIHYAYSNPEEVMFKQKELRKTVLNQHTNAIRAKEMMEVVKNQVLAK